MGTPPSAGDIIGITQIFFLNGAIISDRYSRTPPSPRPIGDVPKTVETVRYDIWPAPIAGATTHWNVVAEVQLELAHEVALTYLLLYYYIIILLLYYWL